MKAVKGNDQPIWKGKNWLGEKFGSWTVIGFGSCSRVIGSNNYKTTWKVRCDCGTLSEVFKEGLTQGKTLGCRNCYKERHSGSNNHNWRGEGSIPSSLLTQLIGNAKVRNIKVEIGFKELNESWEFQKGLCALSGLEIQIGENASLDRINSNLPYCKENIQWVHKDINRMKNYFDQDHFIRICKLIAKKNPD